MYCRKCGAELAEGARFCTNCGSPQVSGQPDIVRECDLRRPDNHLVLAILTTILCCQPFGIVSIVFASKVDSYWNNGDYLSARKSSERAKIWAIIGIVSSILLGILYILFFVILGVAEGFGGDWWSAGLPVYTI